MASIRRGTRARARLGLAGALALVSAAAAETVTLKTGVVYRGAVDRDNTLVSIFDADGLKRVILRDSKISRTEGDEGSAAVERFAIDQPLTRHAGEMPSAAVGIRATPWDRFGRRRFQYVGPRGELVKMTQAIINLGPRASKIRGVDGFWNTQISTSTIPRTVVLDILGKVDQKNARERVRVCRFLIQAGWYDVARAEVERLGKDFASDPATAEQAKNALGVILESEARNTLFEIETRRKAQQPRSVATKLRTFATEGAPADTLAAVREQIRKDQARAAADKALADSLRSAAEKAKVADRTRLNEILDGLTDAPDAVRGRLEAFEGALAEGAKPEEVFATALSGWVAGSENAVKDLKSAEAMWSARNLADAYLASAEAKSDARSSSLQDLQAIQVAGKPIAMETLTEIVRRMPPPLRNEQEIPAGKPLMLRVRDDPNPDQPSEYAVILPPEYSPLRTYPLVVALHGDETPSECLSWWSAEAARRGVVVIAPEYNLRDRPRDYRYSESEHAAVELSLRDALRRFSVDPDRVFLGGSLFGGNMAWDFGLAHPDLFAGVAVISGLPAKYVWATKANITRVPFYVAMGDLAPAETDVIFGELARPMITANRDMTYVEYYRRGLEDLPEEAPAVFDWMAPRRRDPAPKTFEVVAARNCDDRFYGLVVKEFVPGRAKDPAAVDIQGKNLRPATLAMRSNNLVNLLDITISGVKRLDVWVSPKFIDFGKRLEVRINRKTVFKGMPKADLESFLEDVRIRGDRSQVFWMRVQAG